MKETKKKNVWFIVVFFVFFLSPLVAYYVREGDTLGQSVKIGPNDIMVFIRFPNE